MANCVKCRFSLNLKLFSVVLKSAPVKYIATYCHWDSHQIHSSCTSMSLWWQNNPSLWLSWTGSVPKWVSILWHAACAPSDAKLLEGGVAAWRITKNTSCCVSQSSLFWKHLHSYPRAISLLCGRWACRSNTALTSGFTMKPASWVNVDQQETIQGQCMLWYLILWHGRSKTKNSLTLIDWKLHLEKFNISADSFLSEFPVWRVCYHSVNFHFQYTRQKPKRYIF